MQTEVNMSFDYQKSIDFLLENGRDVIQYRLHKDILHDLTEAEEKLLLEKVMQTPEYQLLLTHVKPNGYIGIGMHSWEKFKASHLDDGENAARLLHNYGIPKDKQVIHIISEIQLSELLRMLPKPNDFLLKFDFADISYIGLGKGYEQLVSIYEKLADFVDTRHAYQMVDISNDEIDEWQKDQAESLQKHPEIAQVLIEMQREHK